MLCNTDILINVTPIFIQAFADSLSLINFDLFWLLCTYCTILTKLCYCHLINMMSGWYNVLTRTLRLLVMIYGEEEALLGSWVSHSDSGWNYHSKECAGRKNNVPGLKVISFCNQITHRLMRIYYVVDSIKADQDELYMLHSEGATSVSVRIGIDGFQSMCIIWGCPSAVIP